MIESHFPKVQYVKDSYIIVILNIIGPIVYLIFGREDE